MKKKLIFFLLCLPFGLLGAAGAQELHVRFEPETANMKSDYTFASGVRGWARDMTSRAANRDPITIDSTQFDALNDFSIAVWVKTNDDIRDGKTIVTNISKNSSDGFALGTTAEGSWFVRIVASGEELIYEPTLARQPINNGIWHLLALTYNRHSGEMRMYYDGQNVATYNVQALCSGSRLVIGGDSSAEEMYSFNGMIDELHWYDRQLTEEEHFAIYSSSVRGAKAARLAPRLDSIKVMAFNIWHGGRHRGEQVGVERVVEIIKESGADVIGMVETYGSGAKIADALGYYFYLHSSNLSIMSRFPIVQTYDIFRSFNCSGAMLQVSQRQSVNILHLWLDYLPSTDQQINTGVSPEDIVKGEWKTRGAELQEILKQAKPLIENSVPLFVTGDFNAGSHLDFTPENAAQHKGYAIEWVTSQLMEQAGFTDSFRAVNPSIKENPGITWSPEWKNELQYRIDFVYSHLAEPTRSVVIDKHHIRFPSDHAAVVSTFLLPK